MEPVYLCVGVSNLKGFLAIKGGSNLMKNFNFDSPSGMKEKKTVSSKPSGLMTADSEVYGISEWFEPGEGLKRYGQLCSGHLK